MIVPHGSIILHGEVAYPICTALTHIATQALSYGLAPCLLAMQLCAVYCGTSHNSMIGEPLEK